MIVDCHTHIGSPSEALEISDHQSVAETVDFSIVLAGCDGESSDMNKQLSEYVAKNPEKMIGFATIDPRTDIDIAKKVSTLRDKLGLKGVVFYCCRRGFHPAHSRAMRFYEAAEELQLPIFFHNAGKLSADSVLDYSQPYLVDEISRKFPHLKIIIGSMGFPFIDQTFALLAKHKNVFADLTVKPGSIWQVYNTVISAFEHGVMDKLLFGSGFPDGKAGNCIETLLGFNKLLGDTNLPTVPRVNIRNIIERDTLQLLGIKEPESN